MLATGDSQSSLRLSDTASEDSLQFAEIQEITGSSGQVTTRGNVEEDADVAVVGQEHVHRLHCQPVKAADHQASQELSYSAETVGRSNALQDVENESLRAKARTSNEQSHGSGQSHQRLDTGRDTKAGKLERAKPDAGILAEMSVVAAGPSGLDQPPSYDPGHLEDATHSRFEAQQRETYGEKSAQQKTEEEIVIEYIKKQSLLEAYHQSKGKGRATATEPANDEDDEDLHRALKLSLQERGSLQWEASGV
nr:hypothetical protein CFP56_38731 [Quercus suber]